MNNFECIICNQPDHFFFRWSTSRYFNRKKVLDILNKGKEIHKYDRHRILHGTYKVCGRCCEKYSIMEH